MRTSRSPSKETNDDDDDHSEQGAVEAAARGEEVDLPVEALVVGLGPVLYKRGGFSACSYSSNLPKVTCR